MIDTLENVRIREGDRVIVAIGPAHYEAEVVDAADPSKLKIRLCSGTELWIGRGAVVEVSYALREI